MTLKSISFIFIFLLSYIANSQSLQIFDIDTTDFPTMRAKFYAIDKNGKPVRPNINDLELFELGTSKKIVDVRCPIKPPRQLSVAIMVDTYFYIELARNGTKRLVNFLNMPNDEVGITYMNHSALIFQDFVNVKSKALEKAKNIPFAPGGTSINDMFNSEFTGGIPFIKDRLSEKKILILVSDLHCPNLKIDEQKLISDAKSYNIAIYSILLNTNDYSGIFSRIAAATGARIFENVKSESQINNIFEEIPKVQQYSPCEIEWESNSKCTTGDIEVTLAWNEQYSQTHYVNPKKGIAKLEFEPKYIAFGRVKPNTLRDTIIKIKAINSKYIIDNIKQNNSTNVFTVINHTFPITIQKDEIVDLQIRFSPLDSLLNFEELEFETNMCNFNVNLSGGYPEYRVKKPSLKLVEPNGNEKYHAGSDSTIVWSGISKEENVKLEFSYDKGKSWNNIAENTSGLKYDWKNIPLPKSDSCLIRVTQVDNKLSNIVIPSIDWDNYYGGSKQEESVEILELEDGYIILGNTYSNDIDIKNGNKGNLDYWLIETDKFGHILWEQNYGGSSDDKASSIIKTEDNGYLIVGSTLSNNLDIKSGNKGKEDYWVLKINNKGLIEWEKTYGGSNIDIANDVIATKDNNFIIAGYTNSNDGDISEVRNGLDDYWILKINSYGDILWQKKLGGNMSEIAKSIILTEDDACIIGGSSMSYTDDVFSGNKGGYDFWMVKLDKHGVKAWEKSYGGPNTEELTTLYKTKDGGFIAGGRTESKDGDVKAKKTIDSDIWLIKMNEFGKLEWSQHYGGTNYEYLKQIIEIKDGGYVLTAYSSSKDGDVVSGNKGGTDIWNLRISTYGSKIWEQSIGTIYDDITSSIIKTKDNGFIVLGSSKKESSINRDLYAVKLFSDVEYIQSDISDTEFSIIAPEPRFDKLNVDMGQVIVNGMKDTLVTAVFCNQGDARLHVLGVDVTAGDTSEFQVPRGAGEFFLEVGECRDLMFEYIPNQLGNRQAKVTVRTTIGDYRDTIKIIGEGVQPKLQLLSEFVDFGVKELYTQIDSIMYIIKNLSNFPITIDSLSSIGPDTTQFKFKSPESTFTLDPNESKSMNIKFLPKFNGRTSGRIAFYYNQVASPLIAQLFGAGLGAVVNLTKDSAYPGQNISHKLVLKNTNPKILSEFVSRVEGIVRFESSILSPKNQSNILKIQNDSTYIKFTGVLDANSNYLTGIDLIAGLGKIDESTIDIEELKWFDNNGLQIEYDTQVSSGHFKLLGVCYEGVARLINPSGQSAQILSISPNPAENWLDLEVSLIEKGATEISIFNIKGEKIKTLLNEEIETTGTFNLSSDLQNISSGQYYIILKTPTYIETNQLIIVK